VNASAVEGDHLFFGGSPTHAVMLHGESSGVFPHAPEPTLENLSAAGGLCDAVRGLGACAGFAQDPDADRLAIIDERGRYIGEEYTLALAAEAVLGAMGPDARGRAVCTNLSTSRMLDDVAARHGARVIRTAVGEANVVEAMKASGAVIGGEGNGGVIWPEITFVRDSLSAMALVMGLVARSGRTIGDLVASMPQYAIVKRKADLSRKSDADPALDAIAQRYASASIDRQDGVRVDFADRWVHVRPSNTEPILRLIAEAPTQSEAQSLLEDVEGIVQGSRG
jgi:phosphomannomutase